MIYLEINIVSIYAQDLNYHDLIATEEIQTTNALLAKKLNKSYTNTYEGHAPAKIQGELKSAQQDISNANQKIQDIKESGTVGKAKIENADEIYLVKNKYYKKQEQMPIIAPIMPVEQNVAHFFNRDKKEDIDISKEIQERKKELIKDDKPNVFIEWLKSPPRFYNFYVAAIGGLTLESGIDLTSSESGQPLSNKMAPGSVDNFSLSTKLDNGYNFSGAFGIHFGNFTRFEFTGFFIGVSGNTAYQQSRIFYEKKTPLTIDAKSSFDINTFGELRNVAGLLGTFYIDTNRTRRIFLSFGAGPGIAFLDFSGGNIESGVSMAWNGAVQMNIRLFERLYIFGEYKMIGIIGRDFDVHDPVNSNGSIYTSVDVNGNLTPNDTYYKPIDTNRILTNNSAHLSDFIFHNINVGIRWYF